MKQNNPLAETLCWEKKKRWTEYEWQPSLISFLSMEYFQQICCSSLAHSTHCRALPRKCQLTGWSIFDNLFILCSIRMFNTHCQVRRCLKQHSKNDQTLFTLTVALKCLELEEGSGCSRRWPSFMLIKKYQVIDGSQTLLGQYPLHVCPVYSKHLLLSYS